MITANMFRDIPRADERMEMEIKVANDKYENELNSMSKKDLIKTCETVLFENLDFGLKRMCFLLKYGHIKYRTKRFTRMTKHKKRKFHLKIVKDFR